jgi:hypothetical protein
LREGSNQCIVQWDVPWDVPCNIFFFSFSYMCCFVGIDFY